MIENEGNRWVHSMLVELGKNSVNLTYLTGLPLGSVKDHLGSIGGVDASTIEGMLGRISPSSFF